MASSKKWCFTDMVSLFYDFKSRRFSKRLKNLKKSKCIFVDDTRMKLLLTLWYLSDAHSGVKSTNESEGFSLV